MSQPDSPLPAAGGPDADTLTYRDVSVTEALHMGQVALITERSRVWSDCLRDLAGGVHPTHVVVPRTDLPPRPWSPLFDRIMEALPPTWRVLSTWHAAVDALIEHSAQLRRETAEAERERDDATRQAHDWETIADQREAEVTTLAARLAGMTSLVREQMDDDACHYDHHGYCQTHGLFERPCWQERARAALTPTGTP